MSRLLVVEDDALVACDLRNRLAGLGYDIVGTTSYAEQAIEMTGVLHPDIVLMDVHLQGAMDGVAAAAVIRRQHDVPVIFFDSPCR